jgi:hypothetical protein
MIYNPFSRIGWSVATALLVAGLVGTASCAWYAWHDSDWSYVLLGRFFIVCGVGPIVNRLRSPKK